MKPRALKVVASPEQSAAEMSRDFSELTHGITHLLDRSTIADIKLLGSVEKSEGTIERYGLITEDGYAYAGTVTVPKQQTNDIAVVGKSAWFTSSRGHNEHTSLKFAQDGLVTFYLGNEGSYRPHKNVVPKSPMTLADTAAVVLHFARFAADSHADHVNQSIITEVGESEGGMEGMGVVALAETFGFRTLMADYTAPCIPRKLEAKDAVGFTEQVLKEPSEVLRLGGRLALQLIINYPSTIDLHPYALLHQIAKGAAIFSGDAGKLGELVPKHTNMHITTFDKDYASMPIEWERIFQHHPNVRLTRLLGRHLTIADPETLAYVRARQQAARIIYEDNDRDISRVAGHEIYDFAHGLVPYYLPKRPQHPVNKFLRRITGSRSIVPGSKAA